MADTSDSRTPVQIEADIKRRRETLAETLDEIGVRVHPKTIVGREVSDLKAFFVDRSTGEPRTENILKVVGGIVGTIALFVLIRRVAR